jgi:hypothetical protein
VRKYFEFPKSGAYTFASGGSASATDGKKSGKVKARDANPVVGHPVIDIEAVR